MQPTFEAALTFRDDALAFVEDPERTLLRTLTLAAASDRGFGLLEPGGSGWTLCIPDGADAEASIGDRPVDLARLPLDPSGERRLRVEAGLSARVRMGEFRFELRPSA